MMEAMMMRSGKSCLSSFTPWHQYAAVFSEISSIFRKEPCPGP
jgi:hypothetical protein